MNEELIKKSAIKVKLYGNLDSVITSLYKFKNENKNVYVDFNGNFLYSLLDDIDSCYIKVTGQTRAEYRKAEKQWRDEYLKKEAEETEKAIASINIWIEEGKSLVYPQRFEEWKKCVKARAKDKLYHGLDLVNALETMKEIEKSGNFEKAKDIIDNANNSGASYSMIMNIITAFSKKGPEFYEFMEPEYSKMAENAKYLSNVKALNTKFAKELANKAQKNNKSNTTKPAEPGDC